jgi:hypothetical protein
MSFDAKLSASRAECPMIGDRFRHLLNLGAGGPAASQAGSPSRQAGYSISSAGGAAARLAPIDAPESVRHSHGLEQFFTSLSDKQNGSILDLSGASQANVSFITSLGYRLYSDDLLRSLESVFGREQFLENQTRADRMEAFLCDSLNYPAQHFDGALVWDMLQYLASPLLERTVARLYRILKPGSYLLCFFCAQERTATVPLFTYRIADSKTLHLIPRGRRQVAQVFNNRSIERLFQNFDSVKFFLTRESLREVIVRR